jgi:dienelactone hydrolase
MLPSSSFFSKSKEYLIMEKLSAQRAGEGFVRIDVGAIFLEGNLIIPANARGIVLFAHGSGSGRHSPRNRYVAEFLQQAGLATLLIDLLTADEEAIDNQTMHLRFDIGMLAERLTEVTRWLERNPDTKRLKVGYFGASTGAGAALLAAANQEIEIAAIVSRGGRPDLAGEALALVRAPTLLIVGQNDPRVLVLNQQAFDALGVQDKKMVVIPGATHLFEEPGTLEEVARIATEWLKRRMSDE